MKKKASERLDKTLDTAVKFLDNEQAGILLSESCLGLAMAWSTRRGIRRAPDVVRKIRRGEPLTRKDASALLDTLTGSVYFVARAVVSAKHSVQRVQDANTALATQRRNKKRKKEVPAADEKGTSDAVARAVARAAAQEAKQRG